MMENSIKQKIGYDGETQYLKKVFGEKFDRTFTDALGVVSDLINDSMEVSEIEVYGHIKEGIQRNLSDRLSQLNERKSQISGIKNDLSSLKSQVTNSNLDFGNFLAEAATKADKLIKSDQQKHQQEVSQAKQVNEAQAKELSLWKLKAQAQKGIK